MNANEYTLLQNTLKKKEEQSEGDSNIENYNLLDNLFETNKEKEQNENTVEESIDYLQFIPQS